MPELTNLRGLRRNRRGVTAIEVAIVFPVFILLVLGTLDFCRALWLQNALQGAVESAARCAALNPVTCGTAANIQAYAATQVAGFSIASSAFSATTAACGQKVTASYPFTFIPASLPPFNSLSLTLSAQSCRPT